MRVPAKRKLREWLKSNKDKGWNQTRLAKTVDADQSSVSRWCDDDSKERPSDQRQGLIEKLTGIERVDWLTAKERKEAERAEERVRQAGAAE